MVKDRDDSPARGGNVNMHGDRQNDGSMKKVTLQAVWGSAFPGIGSTTSLKSRDKGFLGPHYYRPGMWAILYVFRYIYLLRVERPANTIIFGWRNKNDPVQALWSNCFQAESSAYTDHKISTSTVTISLCYNSVWSMKPVVKNGEFSVCTSSIEIYVISRV